MGKITPVHSSNKAVTDMRVLLLCYFFREGLMEIAGTAFGWDSSVYFDREQFREGSGRLAVIASEGIDFERSFYQIN